MIQKIKYFNLFFLVLCITLCCLSYKVKAAPDKSDGVVHNLHIYYQYENTPLNGAQASIYKISSLQPNNTSNLFQTEEDFLPYKSHIESLENQSDWKNLCDKLEKHIKEKNINYYKTTYVNHYGVAEFNDVQPGIYFVRETVFKGDNRHYRYESFIVIIPHNLVNTASANVIKAYPKGVLMQTSSEEPDETKKKENETKKTKTKDTNSLLVSKQKIKTGDYNKLYLIATIFIISGLIMLVLILKKGRRNENRK